MTTQTMTATTALAAYDRAVTNAETIGADGWRTLAGDLCTVADELERQPRDVETQRKLRDRATDCAMRARRLESRAAASHAPLFDELAALHKS